MKNPPGKIKLSVSFKLCQQSEKCLFSLDEAVRNCGLGREGGRGRLIFI